MEVGKSGGNFSLKKPLFPFGFISEKKDSPLHILLQKSTIKGFHYNGVQKTFSLLNQYCINERDI